MTRFAQGNNFFFTTDQGYDAVYAREIWSRGQLLLKGPETNIPGVFAGSGWFYFISAGYKLFNGHPFGAVFLMILLSLATTGLVLWQVAKHVSPSVALLIGAALQIFWPFYDTSRYAFNPFPLVFLAILEILLLVNFLQGKKSSYFWAVLPVILAFNTEVAGAFALLLFYLTVGVWAVLVRRLPLKIFIVFMFFSFLVFLSQTGRNFLVVAQASQGSALGTFSGTNFGRVGVGFLEILKNSIVPQNLWISLVLFGGAMFGFFRTSPENKFKMYFITLTLTLTLTSYLFFSTNKGWRDWHTLYLPPLIFISFILAATNLSKKFSAFILGAVFLSQFLVFKERYLEYLRPSDNPSILANQLRALDWIYQNSEGDGFNAYVYLADDDHDFPYQYLFWWYGRGKYGFVPCEYQNLPYPVTSKHTYVPGSLFYNQPTLGCDKFRFLVIEEDKDIDIQQAWLRKASGGTSLLEEKKIGHIRVQKRKDIAFRD
ncbi:MAG: hypothetical protein HYS83_01310 [Candidatus Blackburnbacteria bacterium]|nr:hypothetical protein [Candidatus Blackburnbacteria bacterium]